MTTPAGWYPDPTDSTRNRWWDGMQWTENYAPAAPQAAPTAPAAPSAAPGYAAAPQHPASAYQTYPAAPPVQAAPSAPGADTNTLYCTGSGRTRSAARTDDLARKAGVAVWNADQRLKTGDLYAQLGWKPSGPKSRDYTAAIRQAVREDFIKQTTESRTKWHSPGTVDPRTDTERCNGGSPSTPGAPDA